jgi:hypothetical protein
MPKKDDLGGWLSSIKGRVQKMKLELIWSLNKTIPPSDSPQQQNQQACEAA